MSRSHEIDMTSGPIFPKILMFSLPLMAGSILQLLFNAADTVVVGKFAGSLALAAVGSNGSLINLLVNLFIGFSTGANVLAARYFGANNQKSLTQCVHCSIALGIVLGIFVGTFGFFFSSSILHLMNVEPEVLPLASLYLKIYFLGVPATLVYNFGAALLRSVGDTKRPFIFLSIAGVVNVVLNLIFVVGFHLSVAGVAIATAVSQYIAAILVIRCLVRTDGACHLSLRSIRLHRDMSLQIVRVGFPIGLQSTLFSLSNVVIQSAINSFGHVVMAANSAASSLDGFVYVVANSISYAALSFISQNYGAKQFSRMKRIIVLCLTTSAVMAAVMGLLMYMGGEPLLSVYVSKTDPEWKDVISAGMVRLKFVMLFYFLCGLMDTLTGALRGLGKSWMPMIITLIGACLFRILWIQTVFAAVGKLEYIYFSYPISWSVTAAAQLLLLISTYKKRCRVPTI